MPIPVVCGSCNSKLVAPDAAAGKKVKCKNCQSVIAVPEPEESDFEFVDSAPAKPMAAKPVVVAAAAPVKPKSKPTIVIDEETDEFDFTASPKKSKSKAAIEDGDDETPKPKRKSKPAVVEDEDDDEEYDAPKRRQKSKKAKANSNPLKFVVIGVVALLAVGFLGAMVWYVAIRDDKPVLSGPLAGGKGGSGQPKDPLAG